MLIQPFSELGATNEGQHVDAGRGSRAAFLHPWLGAVAQEVDGHGFVNHELPDAGHGGEVLAHRDPLAVCMYAGVAVSAPDQKRVLGSGGQELGGDAGAARVPASW